MKRNPYRRYMRNVHVRRLLIIFVFPLVIPFFLFAEGAKAAWILLPEFLVLASKALADPNSYE